MARCPGVSVNAAAHQHLLSGDDLGDLGAGARGVAGKRAAAHDFWLNWQARRVKGIFGSQVGWTPTAMASRCIVTKRAVAAANSYALVDICDE